MLDSFVSIPYNHGEPAQPGTLAPVIHNESKVVFNIIEPIRGVMAMKLPFFIQFLEIYPKVQKGLKDPPPLYLFESKNHI